MCFNFKIIKIIGIRKQSSWQKTMIHEQDFWSGRENPPPDCSPKEKSVLGILNAIHNVKGKFSFELENKAKELC